MLTNSTAYQMPCYLSAFADIEHVKMGAFRSLLLRPCPIRFGEGIAFEKEPTLIGLTQIEKIDLLVKQKLFHFANRLQKIDICK